MGLYRKLFLYFSALALLAQCQDDEQDPALTEDAGQEDADLIQDKDKMQAIHKKMDIDGDGKLSLNEVIEFSRSTRKDMAAKSSADSMDMYDKNKDGKVSLEELMENDFGGNDVDTSELTPDDKKMDEEMKELEKAKFAAADKNKDGILDKDEIGHMMYPEASPDVLKVVVMATVKGKDQDGDGKLDSKEFYHSRSAGEDMETDAAMQEEMKKEFAELDVDGDGKLSEKELHGYESGEYHMLSAFKALFADADTDKDSHLSLDEFWKHMPQMPELEAASHITEWMFHHEL